jgi:hypothetical protein
MLELQPPPRIAFRGTGPIAASVRVGTGELEVGVFKSVGFLRLDDSFIAHLFC